MGYADSFVVSVETSVSNRGNRTPEIERVFGVEHGDVGIGSGHLREGEEPGGRFAVFSRGVAKSRRHFRFCAKLWTAGCTLGLF
jgi:hypothetical protein